MAYSGMNSGYTQLLRDRANRPDERFRELMNMILMMKQTQEQRKNTEWEHGFKEKEYGLSERGQDLAEKQAGYMEPLQRARTADLMREPVDDLSPDAKSFMFWKKRYPDKTDEEIHAIKNKWKTPKQLELESHGKPEGLEHLPLDSKLMQAQIGKVLNLAQSRIDHYAKSFGGYVGGPEGLASNPGYASILGIQKEMTKLIRKKSYTPEDVAAIDSALEILMSAGGVATPQPTTVPNKPQRMDKDGNIVG